MGGNDDRWTRADWARWFVYRDEVDEAARVLEVGDELLLGRSDYLNLIAALSRRGLTATYEDGDRRVRIVRADPAASSRRPAVRAPGPPVATSSSKKIA